MPDTPNRDITSDRKAIYYTGMTFVVVGMLSFFSVFVTGCMHFGDFENFEERSRSDITRGIGGMIAMIVGGFLMNLGRHGAAGSGVVLDPQKTRKDLEPWSRAAGGMTSDALDEIELAKKLAKKLDEPAAPPPVPVVKIRCRGCNALNDEAAKFCNQCGAAM